MICGLDIRQIRVSFAPTSIRSDSVRRWWRRHDPPCSISEQSPVGPFGISKRSRLTASSPGNRYFVLCSNPQTPLQSFTQAPPRSRTPHPAPCCVSRVRHHSAGYCGGYAILGMQKYRRKKNNPCMLRAREKLRSRIVLLKRGFGPQDQAILRDREPLFPRTGTTSVSEDPRRMLNPVFLVPPARRALSKGQYWRGVAGAMRHRQSFFRRLRVQDPLCTQGKDSVCPTVGGVSWKGDNLPSEENAVLARKRERGEEGRKRQRDS